MVKIVDKNEDSQIQRCLIKEIKVLSSLQHKNVITYIGHNLNSSKMQLQLEFAEYGSLPSLKWNLGIKFNDIIVANIIR